MEEEKKELDWLSKTFLEGIAKYYTNTIEVTKTVRIPKGKYCDTCPFLKYETALGCCINNDCFSGKRPFGNSGWYYDIIICLIHNKIIKGTTDIEGYLEDYNELEAFAFIEKLIKEL